MADTLDQQMQHASQRLADLDYLGCEALCLGALAEARQAESWTAYARILLPLQECRRQRRLIAADAAVQLGTNACWADTRDGCVAVTHPLDRDAADKAVRHAAERGRHVEVLWCDNPAEADVWTIKTVTGPTVSCDVPAPPAELVHQRVDPGRHHAAAHWFIAASETLGNAALASVEAPLGTLDRVGQLEAMLAAVGDHELLHQRLADAARALIAGTPA